MREDKAKKMWIFLEAKLKLVIKEGIDNAYVMQYKPLVTEWNLLSGVKMHEEAAKLSLVLKLSDTETQQKQKQKQ